MPKTIAALNADLARVKAANAKDPRFSAFYMPGKYWYGAMSFVYGAGGKIATMSGGKWTGTLGSAQAQQGLAAWRTLATKYSVGGATKDEADQDAIMAQGHTAAILGNGWEDLAVPAKASNPGLGAQWIKYYTDTTSQTGLAKFAIPNTTSLLSVYEGQAQANKSTGEAAKNTWFVPNTPNWANVESGNVLQNMLESIATGKSSIAAAAASADKQIASILNKN